VAMAAARRLLSRPYAAMAAMSLDAAALADTEEDLLRAGDRAAINDRTPAP
jgi:hypothetical protein